MNGLRSGSVMARPGEGLAAVPLETRHFEDLGRYLAAPMIERVRVAQQHAGELLAGRTVWMVNSTASGGGETAASHTAEHAAAAGGMVLLTLASAQFLMTLDSSVMNMSIVTVAEDPGTTATGIQTAITLYTLVMASLMITGGKAGQILGRKRAFAIGCVIYGCGSLTTALAPNLAVLMLRWPVLEGAGAALIMPAIVALVASNFARDQRPRAHGLAAPAGAIAVAAGPATLGSCGPGEVS